MIQIRFIVGGDPEARAELLDSMYADVEGEERFNDNDKFIAKYDKDLDQHHVFIDEGEVNVLKNASVIRDYLNIKNSFFYVVYSDDQRILDFKKQFQKNIKDKEMKIIRVS